MHRRHFIRNLGLLGLIGTAPFVVPSPAAAASLRRAKWAPTGKAPSDASQSVVAEWRYLAGNFTTGTTTFGFVVSLGMTRTLANPLDETYQLLVEKVNLSSGKNFVHALYDGVRSFDGKIDRYIFNGETEDVSMTWEWDDTSGVYRLNLSTPELHFYNMVLRPCGDLIPEGGSGTISAGEFGIGGLSGAIGSTYHADWVNMEMVDTTIGTARLDMQSLYITGEGAESSGDYDHTWFALAGDLDGEPVYLSAWRIESSGGAYWDVTVARQIDGVWSAHSVTESSDTIQPLQVTPLAFQPIPDLETEPNFTGSSWRLIAGTEQPLDLLDLTLSVPPGQFVSSARLGMANQGQLMEGIGIEANGSILGKQLTKVRLVVAESTVEAEPSRMYVPLAGF